MAYVTYYFNGYSSSNATNPAYACNDNTTDYATFSAMAAQIAYSSTNCLGVNYGTITSVYAKPYWYHGGTIGAPLGGRIGFYDDKDSMTNIRNAPYGWTEESVDITAYPNHPAWTWANISSLPLRVWMGYFDNSPAEYGYLYRTRIVVYYTPVASTAAWSAPTNGSTQYRAGTGVAISGTAANANGVYSVEYKIDSGSWVLCTGTTSWSATIPQSSLTHGSHTLTLRVRDSSTDYAYTTIGTTRTIIQSPLPAQTI